MQRVQFTPKIAWLLQIMAKAIELYFCQYIAGVENAFGERGNIAVAGDIGLLAELIDHQFIAFVDLADQCLAKGDCLGGILIELRLQQAFS